MPLLVSETEPPVATSQATERERSEGLDGGAWLDRVQVLETAYS